MKVTFKDIALCILLGTFLFGFLIWQAILDQKAQDVAREKYRQEQQLYYTNPNHE